MPDLPTYREQGVDALGSARRGFVAPPGMPEELTQRLITAFAAMLADAAFLREAERLAMGLAMDAELRALWAARRWTQG